MVYHRIAVMQEYSTIILLLLASCGSIFTLQIIWLPSMTIAHWKEMTKLSLTLFAVINTAALKLLSQMKFFRFCLFVCFFDLIQKNQPPKKSFHSQFQNCCISTVKNYIQNYKQDQNLIE